MLEGPSSIHRLRRNGQVAQHDGNVQVVNIRSKLPSIQTWHN